MEISRKISDTRSFVRPKLTASDSSNFSVYPLQGAQKTYFYCDGQWRHGFMTQDRVITPARFTSYHRCFHVNGVDKYAVARIWNNSYSLNKLELVSLENGEPVLEHFGAYQFDDSLLAYRVDKEDSSLWGIFDMSTGERLEEPTIPYEKLSEVWRRYTKEQLS